MFFYLIFEYNWIPQKCVEIVEKFKIWIKNLDINKLNNHLAKKLLIVNNKNNNFFLTFKNIKLPQNWKIMKILICQ